MVSRLIVLHIEPGTLNPGWSREPLEPDDTSSSRWTSRAQHSVNRVRELSTSLHLFGYRHERAASGFRSVIGLVLSHDPPGGSLSSQDTEGLRVDSPSQHGGPPRLSTRVVVRLRDGSTHAPSIRLRTPSLDRTCRGCHLLRSGLAAFNDGITKYALRSERCVHDVVAHRDPTLHATASGFKARRLRATREVSKARGSPRR